MKVYFVAGEDSGDLHTRNLIRELKVRYPQVQTRGVGGDKMAEQGTELIAHIRDINFMGFLEVIRNLQTIRKLFATVKNDILTWRPDAVVLVDYPGFNLRLAKFVKSLGITLFYYISPQIWAWKKGRVKIIRRYVDRMLVILPFEKDFYRKEGVEVDFVGHPLLDEISHSSGFSSGLNKVIALLPGSRKQEISRMLPVMLKMVDRFPEYRFVIAGAPSQEENFYREIIQNAPAELVMNKTYDVLASAQAALVTSGTATLETALFNVPQVVCYRGSAFSYEIGKRLVKVSFISLVNLILNRSLVTELIQYDFQEDRLEAELRKILLPEIRRQKQAGYEELHRKLGDGGASAKAAAIIAEYLHE
ncbi:MAG: lipid-A-disaccharide synthase [Bacteroidia bacterium]|nr:lipid-A-disaccharide synthase [Bacteroidia bacterium]